MGEVSIGTLYDMNKNIINEMKPLSETKIKEKIKEVKTYFAKGKKYFMLLCHEQRDYTVFSINKTASREENSLTEAASAFRECLENRGIIMSIDLNEDGVVECWIKINEECFAYYLFPYDNAVIHC